jgi:hypothetical protein
MGIDRKPHVIEDFIPPIQANFVPGNNSHFFPINKSPAQTNSFALYKTTNEQQANSCSTYHPRHLISMLLFARAEVM